MLRTPFRFSQIFQHYLQQQTVHSLVCVHSRIGNVAAVVSRSMSTMSGTEMQWKGEGKREEKTKLMSQGKEVELRLTEGVTREQILGFRAFDQWFTNLNNSLSLQSAPTHPFHKTPYTLNSVTIKSHTFFPRTPPTLGFLNILADISTASSSTSPSSSLSGSIFLRGPSVAMLIVLTPDDIKPSACSCPRDHSEGEKYTLLTIQPRPAAGSLSFAELPAGMVDNGTFGGAAANEIKEETSLVIKEEELVDLNALVVGGKEEEEGGEGLAEAMYPSAGGCDEFIKLYYCEKKVSREELGELEGKLTGLRDEGEKITLKLIKLTDLWKEGARDAKALGAWALYSGLKANGELEKKMVEMGLR